MTPRFGALSAMAASTLAACAPALAATRLPPAAFDPPAASANGVAIVSGGCFWGVQGVFEHVRGVRQALSGYDGGPAASYEQVSTGTTGNAETVRIVFDPKQISYGEVLRLFFSVATDPTQLNRQFPDEGPQYRSEIWTTNAAQALVARRYIAQLNASRAFGRPIATRVDADHGFHRAEGYHQDYLVHHPGSPYIATFDLPKVGDLKALYPARYRAAPVTVM